MRTIYLGHLWCVMKNVSDKQNQSMCVLEYTCKLAQSMTLYWCSGPLPFSSFSTEAAGWTPTKISRASQLDTVDVVLRERAAAHQNKTTFQFSLPSFQRIAGNLPPWNKRGWMCWPSTLKVNGYLSCQPCLWRGLNASERTHCLTHSCADKTLLSTGSLRVCCGLLRSAERNANIIT